MEKIYFRSSEFLMGQTLKKNMYGQAETDHSDALLLLIDRLAAAWLAFSIARDPSHPLLAGSMLLARLVRSLKQVRKRKRSFFFFPLSLSLVYCYICLKKY